MQGAHYANQCDVLRAYSLVRDDVAGCSILISIGGESVHDGQEFGRERACPLEICTKLLMLCWSNAKIRREMLLHERSPGSGVRTAKEFADWLFVEENEKRAKVPCCDAVGVREA